jgi:anti-sigma-K factor RskA
MSSAHDDLMQLAPAYALGALEGDDRRAFEAHLAECAICAAEVRSLAAVTTGLAQTVPQLSPRPELRNRVLTTVGANVIGPTPHRTAVATASRKPVSTLASWLPFAAILALAAGLAVYGRDQRARMRDLEARVDQSAAAARAAQQALVEARRDGANAQTAIGVLGAPDLVRIDLRGEAAAPQASARALWSRERGMVFTATNLPPLPAGRVYQVWVVTTDPNPISAGLLAPDASGSGVGVFMTPPDIAQPTAVAVTMSPAGGVAAPIGDRYLIGLAGG